MFLSDFEVSQSEFKAFSRQDVIVASVQNFSNQGSCDYRLIVICVSFTRVFQDVRCKQHPVL